MVKDADKKWTKKVQGWIVEKSAKENKQKTEDRMKDNEFKRSWKVIEKDRRREKIDQPADERESKKGGMNSL